MIGISIEQYNIMHPLDRLYQMSSSFDLFSKTSGEAYASSHFKKFDENYRTHSYVQDYVRLMFK